MDDPPGTKRKLEAEQSEPCKRRAAENLDGDQTEEDIDTGGNIETDHELGSSSADQQDEESSLDVVSSEDSNERSEQADRGEDGISEDLEEDEEFDELDEFPWIKSINVPINADGAEDSPQIGHCVAKLIDRDYIRATFHRDMEEPSNDTATVGFGLFDRWGCLKPEFRTHPVKKGTGVWGQELDQGRFLQIEYLSIQEEYQRKGYGKKLFEQVWAKAQDLAVQENIDRRSARKKSLAKTWLDMPTEDEQPTVIDDAFLDRFDKIFGSDEKVSSGCAFAIIWASPLNTREFEAELERLSKSESEVLYQRKQGAVEEFWRAMGFRRIGSSEFFCFARDSSHPSHSLLPQDDYVRPLALSSTARADDQDFPLMDPLPDEDTRDPKKYNDAEKLKLLEARLRSYPATHPTWVSTDRHGNNILHLLARTAEAQSLAWTLRLPFAQRLRYARNRKGETPLEALESQLESDRTWKQYRLTQIVTSDSFNGFTPNQVECLGLLSCLNDPSRSDLSRLAFGCTCGKCLGGFLSPRAAFALVCQAEIYYDTQIEDVKDGIHFSEHWDHTFDHLPRNVKINLKTNKSMRKGFVNIFNYIAKMLQARQLPTTDNVLFTQSNENEWPPNTRNYLQRGGTVYAVLQACFDSAIEEDIYLGNGEHHAMSKEQILPLPACRNDGEFMFARRMCGQLEGLQDEEDPMVRV